MNAYHVMGSIHSCECGHSVADHRQYFGSKPTSIGNCSVPDCQCETYHKRARAA
jgi:hypothetical protein